MKKIYLSSYAIYLLLFLDYLQKESFFPIPIIVINLIFLLVLVFEMVILFQRDIRISINDKSIRFVIFLSFIIIAILLTRSLTDFRELGALILLLILILLNSKLILSLQCQMEFVVLSYIVTIFHFMFVTAKCGINILSEMSHISLLQWTSYNRYRVGFGFYNVNGAGNILACILCLSMLMRYTYRARICTKRNKLLKVLWLVGDIYLTLMLLLTNSRNAIITVLVCIIVMVYLLVMDSEIVQRLKIFLKSVVIIIGIMVLAIYIFPIVNDMYITSSRLNYYKINLSVLNTLEKRAFGIGLVNPGDFAKGSISSYSTNILDNFYIYLLICGGYSISIPFVGMLVSVGVKLYKHRWERTYVKPVFACFIAFLCSGLGETCLFYYLFPSCIIFWTLFVCTINSSRPEDEQICES